MADPRGFLNTGRETPKRRPVDVRIRDWKEVFAALQILALHKLLSSRECAHQQGDALEFPGQY